MAQREPTPLVILGAGGHAKVVIDAVNAGDRFDIVGMLSDHDPDIGETVCGVVVSGPVEDGLQSFNADTVFHVAIGDNAARQKYSERLRDAGRSLATICHPTAWVSPSAVLGEGSYVGPNASVNAQVRAGVSIIVNTGAIVEHECAIGSFTHIAPGSCLTGRCDVGQGVFIGARSVVVPGRRICDGAIVGAGAVVVRDVAPHSVVKGVPAR